MDALERLEELLDAKDEELAKLRNEKEGLERELEGAIDGWRRIENPEDDGNLPLPRLELFYVKRREWYSYDVVYRLVAKHLLGHLVATPFGRTRCDGSANNEPSGPNDLPWRDSHHAIHDAAHLKLPLFKILPGRDPTPIAVEPDHQSAKYGAEHRR